MTKTSCVLIYDSDLVEKHLNKITYHILVHKIICVGDSH